MESSLQLLQTALNERYHVERELGRGGMATVYLALDRKLNRRVALKVLHPDLAAMLGNERFLREIETAAQLTHPHILPLYDSGEANGVLFYVMPFVEGESLRQRLDRESQLPLDETLRIAKGVAGALDHAHRQGVVHRDIKPENILLHQGEPLVADFGIAKAVDAAGGGLTETGLVLGTPAYMSPEQASADSRLDGRSDQYSLACVVYEVLAGEPPYTGSTAQAIIAKRFSEPIPHVSTLRAVPGSVDVAIVRALSKSPADRFSSVGAFSDALSRLSEPPATPTGVRQFAVPSRRAAGALAALSVLALVIVVALRSRPPAVSPAVQRQITFTGAAQSPAISPDGKWLAYVSADSGMRRVHAPSYTLRVQPLPSGDPITLADSVYGVPPAWSPDGTNLLFIGRARSIRGILTVPRIGGRVTIIAPFSWVYGYSHDNRAILRASWDTLVIHEASSGAEVKRITLAGRLLAIDRVDWSPSGRWIALGGDQDGTGVIATIKPDGSGFRVLVENGYAPRWASSEKALYFLRYMPGSSDLYRLDFDPRKERARGEPTLVFSGLPEIAAGGGPLSITSDASTIVYSKGPTSAHIWAIVLEGPRGRLRPRSWQMTSGTRSHATPDLTDDGQSVVFMRQDSLFVMPFTAGGSPRWIPTPPARSTWQPRWSPDGSRVAFTLHDSSGPGLYITDLATGRAAKASGREPDPYPGVAWSPDGARIAFTVEGRRQVVLVDLDTGREASLRWASPGRILAPRFAPDSREIVATHFLDVNAPDGLAWTTIGTGKWKLTETEIANVRPLAWTADGWIYAAVFPGLRSRAGIYRMRPSGTLEPYSELPADCNEQETAMAADARRFVCAVYRSEPDVWMVQNFDPSVR